MDQAVQTLTTPAGVVVIDVADRGPLFRVFGGGKAIGAAVHCFLASHNRSIRIGHDGTGEKSKLFDHLRSLPAAATKTKKVFDRVLGAERDVNFSVAFAAVD